MKKLFFALPLLLAGCQSARVAYYFQPAASPPDGLLRGNAKTTPVALSQPPRAAAASEATALTDAPRRATPKLTGRLAAGALKLRRFDSPHPVPVAELPAAGALAPTTAAPTVSARPLPRLLLKRLVRQQATAGLAHTTESGLGGIALFFIAIVLGALAGLGALVSLIPGVSFFGGVGLAAAGLLVLLLLYSLLSGGKKKTAK